MTRSAAKDEHSAFQSPGKSASAQTQTRRVRSDSLLGRDGLLIIEHNGREYQLRVTASGKLILTA